MSEELLKVIHANARQLRWLARIPRSIKLRRQWSESIDSLVKSNKSCLLDIRRIAFDGEQGRRFHALVSLLSRGGYEVHVVPHLRFLQSANKSFKWKALCATRPYDARNQKQFDLCLSDQLDSHPSARRTLRLTRDTSRAVLPDEIPLPYSHYPLVWDSGEDELFSQYRNQVRHWRLFFGGNFQQSSYSRIRKFTRIRPVNRFVLMNLAFDYFGDRVTRIEGDRQLAAQRTEACEGFVVIDSDTYRLPPQQWLGVLSTADFFLAAPGCDYPLSHNCVESLAIGTIPVLEYNQLFYPPLQDGVNCIAYRGERGFAEAMERVEEMRPGEIQQIRQGAIDYYEQFLSPTALCRQLETEQANSLHVFPYLAKEG